MKEKVIFYLRKVFFEYGKYNHSDLIDKSNIIFENHWNQKAFPTAYNLKIQCDPEFYLEIHKMKHKIEQDIKDEIHKISEYLIDKIKIEPDYNKINVFQTKFNIVKTPWDEINSLQENLLHQISISQHSVDHQKVGLISRTIIEKLAQIVFVPISNQIKSKRDLSKGKFINQLQATVEFEFSGSQNKEIRLFTTSALDYVKKSIELIQKTTHKLDANSTISESCAISIIGLIGLFKNFKT